MNFTFKDVTIKALNLLFPILTIFLVCVIAIWLPATYADNFGIMLDNTCKTMLRNNVYSTCPSYEDIITLFPDTSNQDVSGKLAYVNGIYQRSSAKLFDSFEYYRFTNSSILFIDPPVETSQRIKLIEIKANLDQYLFRGKTQSYNAENHTLTMGVGRYIDSCRVAYIDSANWIFLVGDTMKHMEDGCSPESTTFVSRITTHLNKTTHDIATSYKYKLEQWQKEMITKCGKKVCLYEEGQRTPP